MPSPKLRAKNDIKDEKQARISLANVTDVTFFDINENSGCATYRGVFETYKGVFEAHKEGFEAYRLAFGSLNRRIERYFVGIRRELGNDRRETAADREIRLSAERKRREAILAECESLAELENSLREIPESSGDELADAMRELGIS